MRQPHIATSGTETFLIRVDNYDRGNMQGVFDCVGMDAPSSFNSLSHLFIMIDNFLDQQEETPRPIIRQIDPSFVSSMELVILFRQNHSWQGLLRWDAGQKHATFRSVLELLVIIEMVFGE